MTNWDYYSWRPQSSAMSNPLSGRYRQAHNRPGAWYVAVSQRKFVKPTSFVVGVYTQVPVAMPEYGRWYS